MQRKSIYVLKRTKKVKVRTLVYIDKDLFDQVMELAPKVYGVARGALSMAVEEALRYWLALRSAHTAHTRLNPRPDHRNVYNCVMHCVEEMLGFLPLSVSQQLMENCILRCRGAVDRRTALKWLHIFYLNGWIKPLTVEVRSQRDWRNNKAIELVARAA